MDSWEGRDHNYLHIKRSGPALFGLRVLPAGSWDNHERKGLSIIAVVVLCLAPIELEIRSFDADGGPVNFHGELEDEGRRRNPPWSFTPNAECPRCANTRTRGGKPCPACAVPWHV